MPVSSKTGGAAQDSELEENTDFCSEEEFCEELLQKCNRKIKLSVASLNKTKKHVYVDLFLYHI